MEIAVSRPKLGSLPDVVNGIHDFTKQEVERLTALCYSVFDYEKEHILLGDPTPEEIRQFTHALKDLRATVKRAGQTLSTDGLDWLVDRIDFSLRSLENPMSAEEADRFLAKHFPE
jgi:hypothetical protein